MPEQLCDRIATTIRVDREIDGNHRDACRIDGRGTGFQQGLGLRIRRQVDRERILSKPIPLAVGGPVLQCHQVAGLVGGAGVVGVLRIPDVSEPAIRDQLSVTDDVAPVLPG
ncbi:hypothetical protein D3C72_1904790 [compost metagenome]